MVLMFMWEPPKLTLVRLREGRDWSYLEVLMHLELVLCIIIYGTRLVAMPRRTLE